MPPMPPEAGAAAKARKPGNRSRPAVAAEPRRRRPPPGDRRALVARLWTSAGLHLSGLEAQIASGGTDGIGRDLASLAKVLRDLAALEGETAAPPPPPPDAAALRATIRRALLRLHEAELSGVAPD